MIFCAETCIVGGPGRDRLQGGPSEDWVIGGEGTTISFREGLIAARVISSSAKTTTILLQIYLDQPPIDNFRI